MTAEGGAVSPDPGSSGPLVVVVLAHRDPPLVHRLVDRVTEGTNTIAAVHYDPRGPELALRGSDSVLLVPDPQPCNWGGMDLAQTMLRSIDFASRAVPDLSWVLLVSGQDYPCRSMAAMEEELRTSTADAYLRWFKVGPDPSEDVHPWQARTRRRYLHRRRLPGSHRSVPFPRRPPFRDGTHLYVGDMWVNLRAPAVAHVLDQRGRLGRIEKYLSRSSIPDEALLPSLLLNDAEHLVVVNDRRRYIRWIEGQPHPEFLTVADVPQISASTDFFARKVDSARTSEVLDRLDRLAAPATPA